MFFAIDLPKVSKKDNGSFVIYKQDFVQNLISQIPAVLYAENGPINSPAHWQKVNLLW